MAYNDKHKQFLQHFMQKRSVSIVDAKKINELLFSNENIDLSIELINSKIDPLGFKINKTVCEQNGDINYVFLASFVDDFNLKKDPNKIMFSKLVDYIILSGGFVPYNDAITFHANMSDTILGTFFANKYLVTDNDHHVFLSPLAISELEGYLADKFADKTCMGCMRFVGYGIKCQSCEKFAHKQCLETYFKSSGSQKCLKCSHKLSVDCNPITINYQL